MTFKEDYNKWKEMFATDLEKANPFVNEDAIPIKSVYTPVDLEEKGVDYDKDLGLPGVFPFVRGITPTMYRGETLPYAQYTGRSTVEEQNMLMKRQFKEGVGEMVIAFDLPTQLGFDPDDPRAEGEVGGTGIPMFSLKEWEDCFHGINVGEVYISMVCNAPAVAMVAMHIALAKKQNVEIHRLRGCAQNDILKEYIARGNYIFPLEPSIRLAVDLITFLSKNCPMYQSDFCSIHMREKGATPVQEAAWLLCNAMVYLKAAADRGINIDQIAPSIRFLTCIYHNGFFSEIAKFRALRKLWAKILKEQFGAKNSESLKFRTWISQGGVRQTYQQPLNNIARSTLAALATILSGAQIIKLKPYDEVYGLPSEEGMRNAVRCSQVVFYETDASSTVDPLAGSYFVESLTLEYVEKIMAEIDKINNMGGMLKAIENNYLQKEMFQNSYSYQKAMEKGQINVIGVNKFLDEGSIGEIKLRPYQPKSKAGEDAINRVRVLRQNRDNELVKHRLEELRDIAKSTENIMPVLLECAEAYATIGEICNTLRDVFGEYQPSFF